MESRIYYLITKTENVMTVYLRQQFQKAGLKVTPAQLGLLFLLKGRDGRTMTELSRELSMDNSAITRAVDRLEKSGLVERNNSADDRREYRITITKTGIAETDGAKKIIAAVNRKIGIEFSQTELDNLSRSLLKLSGIFMD
jgi:DNA-binding MarR family transcriptional regulator